MKKIKIILILVLTILISGCSYKELNDLAIASALGIDYENNEYIISAQIMELKKQEKEDTSSALIYLGKGKTISEALRNISLKYPNYFGFLLLLFHYLSFQVLIHLESLFLCILFLYQKKFPLQYLQ